MAKSKYPSRFLAGFIIFVIYLFAAARPIPPETVLIPHWLSSLESEYPVLIAQDAAQDTAKDAGAEAVNAPDTAAAGLIPFKVGTRFVYNNPPGVFSLKKERAGGVEINQGFWAVYGTGEEAIKARDPANNEVFTIPGDQGYPLFMDGRFFLVGDELSYLTALDDSGNPEWIYDFAAPVTDIDAAAGLVLCGFLDGTVELLDLQGKRIFYFEPGGSRLSVICACRISGDGNHLAVIAGYDDQRFLLLERSGDSWKVIYHEFLPGGFRREVHLAFVDGDRRVAFEWEGGLEIYDFAGRKAHRVALKGRVLALESSLPGVPQGVSPGVSPGDAPGSAKGDMPDAPAGAASNGPPRGLRKGATGGGQEHLLFVITGLSETRKELVVIRFPGSIFMEAPFKSSAAFLRRQDGRIYVGGGSTIAAFELERR
jgi:hypothetical protein